MKNVYQIIVEQVLNIKLMFRLSRYESRAAYQNHYLGIIWEFLNPLTQIFIFYFVFGVGLRAGNTQGVPFLFWMLVGVIPWLFISSSVVGASKSIYSKIGTVSKMKFPVSILPNTAIVTNMYSFLVMLGLAVLYGLVTGVQPSMYWWQFIYYFIAIWMFLFSFGLFNATISTLVHDYHLTIQSVMRVMMYLSGVFIYIDGMYFPEWVKNVLHLNPFYYMVQGFRDTFLSKQFFFENWMPTVVFWCITFFFLIVGSHLHIKFRTRFIDYV